MKSFDAGESSAGSCRVTRAALPSLLLTILGLVTGDVVVVTCSELKIVKDDDRCVGVA